MNDVVVKILNSENKMITYADYMSYVLYDPLVGYYMKNNKKLGPEGDFYTSSGVHRIFGKVFARFFLDAITKEDLPPHILEFGGGDGKFAKAVMDEWEIISPQQKLSYTIIETSPFHRDEQKIRLGDRQEFRQFDSLRTYTENVDRSFEGIIFSNELIDALPVHVIEKNESNFYEVFVTVEDEKLVEKKLLCDNKDIIQWIEKYGPKLVDNQRIEVPLLMNQWLLDVNDFLHRGLIVTNDYGYTKEEWEMPIRRLGSLRGYYKHKMILDTLSYPTEMDLTSHIHLDAYNQVMEELAFDKIIDLRQDRFLLIAGMLKYLEENYDPNPFSEKSKQNRAIRTLISDSGISAAFHVFIHGKQTPNHRSYQIFHENPFDLNK